MKAERGDKRDFTFYFFLIVLIISVLLGVYFRFANLNEKVYSSDEVRAIYRGVGITPEEYRAEMHDGHISNTEEIQSYQKPMANKTFRDVINSMIRWPEHPPLYSLSVRIWMSVFPSFANAKNLSVLFGLLVIPVIYWLCYDLFKSKIAGMIGASLFAISPYHTILAQNAIQYSLWAFAIILSTATLFKASTTLEKKRWIWYCVAITVGIYTHLMFAFVLLAQGLYIFISQLLLVKRFKISKEIWYFAAICLIALILFSPWIYVILTNLDVMNANTTYYRSFDNNIRDIILTSEKNLGKAFFDFYGVVPQIPRYLHLLIVLVILFSIYLIFKKSKPNVWLLILSLIIITPLPMLIPNIITQKGIHYAQSRYFLPMYFGFLLLITYLIISLISNFKKHNYATYIGLAIFAFFMIIGTISGFFITNTLALDQPGIWDRNPEIAAAINEAENQLVISDATHSFILSLSYCTDPEVDFQLLEYYNETQWNEKLDLDSAHEKYSHLFLYLPRQEFKDFILSQNQYLIESIRTGDDNNLLYKLVKKREG